MPHRHPNATAVLTMALAAVSGVAMETQRSAMSGEKEEVSALLPSATIQSDKFKLTGPAPRVFYVATPYKPYYPLNNFYHSSIFVHYPATEDKPAMVEEYWFGKQGVLASLKIAAKKGAAAPSTTSIDSQLPASFDFHRKEDAPGLEAAAMEQYEQMVAPEPVDWRKLHHNSISRYDAPATQDGDNNPIPGIFEPHPNGQGGWNLHPDIRLRTSHINFRSDSVVIELGPARRDVHAVANHFRSRKNYFGGCKENRRYRLWGRNCNTFSTFFAFALTGKQFGFKYRGEDLWKDQWFGSWINCAAGDAIRKRDADEIIFARIRGDLGIPAAEIEAQPGTAA